MHARVLASFALVAGLASGQWTLGPALPFGRSEVAVATGADKLYVIGGFANGNAAGQTLNEEYDANSRIWRERAPLPRGLNHVGAVGFGGNLYAFGGFSAENGRPSADARRRGRGGRGPPPPPR